MADKASTSTPVETGVSASTTTSIYMGSTEEPKAVTSSGDAAKAEIDADGVETTTGLGEDHEDATPDDPDTEESEGEQPDENELGDFDPANEEVVAKYDAKYLTKDGDINQEAFGAEFWANAAKGIDGLSESTYAYLKDRLGISKATVKAIEAGQKAVSESNTAKVYGAAGGKDKLEAAIEWGRKGGYTAAQRQRFNTALASGDPEVATEAVEVLMARFGRASGSPAARIRRPSSPTRSATSSAAEGKGVEGYATPEEHRAALKAASKAPEGEKARLFAEARRRLKASSWARKG